MSLHLLKLCVGAESIADLADWQGRRLADLKKKKKPLVLQHVTRHMPKRKDELLAGGSLYWVIKGSIAARQKLLDFKPVTRNGVPHCAIVYDPEIVPLLRRPHRAFQGWRYFKGEDVPPDASSFKGGKGLPDELKSELAELGLL